MNPFPKYVSELGEHGLSAEIIATLQSNGLAEIRELTRRMGVAPLSDILTDDERREVIKAIWRAAGKPLDIKTEATP